MNGTKRCSTVAIPAIALPAPSAPSTGRQRREIWQARGLADFNRDGRDDVIWHHPQTGDLYVWFMNGTTPTSGAALSPGRFADTEWQLRGLADFNGDGQADLLWHHQTTGDIYVWFMNGTTAVGAAYTNPAASRTPAGSSSAWRTSTTTGSPTSSGSTRRAATSTSGT